MTLSRRQILLAAAAALPLAACGGGSIPSRSGGSSMAAAPNPAFDAWLAGYRGRAAGRGLPPEVISRALRGAGYLPGVVERDRNQTEFTRSLEDYLAIAASDARIRDGRAARARLRPTLDRIEARWGVPSDIVTAIWGLESRYGTRRGDIPVISALATLAFDGRRGQFFERQLDAALRIIAAGDIAPRAMTGSWAGAMGHTQFIPTSYLAFAVDFTGDGRRDIWSDDPADALASAAAYLSRNGWQRGQPWGVEVALPPGFPTASLGRDTRASPSDWAARGVRPARGGALPQAGSASILAPQGIDAPAFMVFRNFRVILTYNNAVNYGIGVGHLADRVRGAPPLAGRFGPDATGLTLEERKEIQRRLTALGFDAGEPDGVIGSGTRAAIESYQRANGLAATGEPSRALLTRLR